MKWLIALIMWPSTFLLASEALMLMPGETPCTAIANLGYELWIVTVGAWVLYPLIALILWLFCDFIDGLKRWPIVGAFFLGLTLIYPAQLLAWEARKLQMSRVAARGDLIVAELDRFHLLHQRWPDEIEPAATGLCAYPKFIYRNARNYGFFLTVPVPRVPLNYDELQHKPTDTPPGATRLGNWIYVHD